MKEIIRGANKIHTDYTYNTWNADGGRLQNLTSTQVSPANNLQNLTYDYDSVGNINTIIDSLSGPQTQSFTYDELDRLLSSDVTGGSNGLYSESYAYDGTTGNLSSKGAVNYTYNSGHAHGVSSLDNGNTYGYDANGNMTSRYVSGQSFTLAYDTENRLVSVTGAATASFAYDGDGKQVIGTVNGVTTYYVGQHYEKKNGVVTKYYFAGAIRIAVRTAGTLSFLLGDHLGSSSVTTDANGGYSAEALYRAFGETRFTDGTLSTDYKFGGQREEASLGIYYFQSRWFDAQLGRFTQPDSIVPTQTQGTQAWDRYAFVNNNPVRYNDPTGHQVTQDDGGCSNPVNGRCPTPSGGPPLKPKDIHITATPTVTLNLSQPSQSDNTTTGPTYSYTNPSGLESYPDPGSPDYYSLDIGIHAASFSFTIDRYGNFYAAAGVNISNAWVQGATYGLVAGNLANPGISVPSETQMESFLTGPAVTASAGFIGGGGVTWSPWAMGSGDAFSSDHFAFEIGAYTPQVGVAIMWGFLVGNN